MNMKTRNALILAVLVAAGCKKAQSSSLTIEAVVPPTAAAAGTAVSCSFDPGASEFTELPYNPAEKTRGNIAAVVQNNILDPSGINIELRLNTASFQPHVAVVDYEYI